MDSKNKIVVGISACLLGEKVRYDGGHKQSKFCLNHLSKVFEFKPYCPEVAIGLGTPREPIRMIAPVDSPRVVGTVSADIDVTEDLRDYGRVVAKQSQSLSGYILMKNSPSCGLYSTKIYRGAVKGEPNLPGKHAGIFAKTLREENPLLPMEEEGRLNDPVLRENFIAQVYAYNDWQQSVAIHPSAKAIVEYHSRYKYLLMSHGQACYKELGRMVAKVGSEDIGEFSGKYIERFMVAIRRPANRKNHANTLFHILGYLREETDGVVRQEIADHIDAYRKGIVNLVVPVTMINHYLKFHGSEYINSQSYLKPYAEDLGLRNSI